MRRAKVLTIGAMLATLAIGLPIRPTLYGPFTGQEALNSGIVLVVANVACVGFEWRGDVGLFGPAWSNDDSAVCA